VYLLKAQQKIANENFDTTLFVDGIAGTGKTTAAIERIKQLIREGAAADSILVLVPQSALAIPYREALRRSRVETGGDIHTTTLGKLAINMVELFFPLIADRTGFANPDDEPHFLSLEMVQYYMTRFIEPEIQQNDYFNSVRIERNRLYTQIVDNLNKAALVNFDYRRIGERLREAWRGDVEQAFIYDDAQAAANRFRDVCLSHNMLDFSLQITLFVNQLWQMDIPRQHLFDRYRHLIVDNIEEDTPVTHDLLREWLPRCESAVILYDTEGGYRRFLGADPTTAYSLRDICAKHVTLDNHRVMSDDVQALQIELQRTLDPDTDATPPDDSNIYRALKYDDHRYHPQMIDWITDSVAALYHEDGVDPGEMVVLAPYLPDSLRFALQTRLDEKGVPNRAHRPSRALRDEPASRTLLTLAKLAHPAWGMTTGRYDVASALTASIAELDLIRARLLTDVLYRNGQLQPFETVKNPAIFERVTSELGIQYERLRRWLDAYQAEHQTDGQPSDDEQPLDSFFSRLFGEVLSQPGFGFHADYDAANTAANLIDSARDFRQTIQEIEPERDGIAQEYVVMVDEGVIANQYVREWHIEDREAVLLAPAYTFLMTNQPVSYQFWLNAGSNGWSQRLYQPLTHPYVLSRQWHEGDIWTDEDEHRANQQMLQRLMLGLVRRCREQIYLGFSEFGEQGYEQRGPLLMTVQQMLRRLQRNAASAAG
jgi:hypothetical protein